MKVCLIGGHLAPAQALLDYLPSTWTPIFIGRKFTFEGDSSYSMEYQTITEQNIPFYALKAARLQRRLTRHMLLGLHKVPYGYIQALNILRKEKPDLVIGFGGYLSLPVAIAARTLRIPVVIHEQTLKAGFANLIISKFARQIVVSWDSSLNYFPKSKTSLVGNLLRKEIVESFKSSTKKVVTELPRIYITGGSGGAHAINQLIEGALPELLKKYEIIHQTGDAAEFKDYDRLTKLKEELPEKLCKRYTLYKFIRPNEIGEIYKSADLVISRSGINTVTELFILEKPCLLIPLQVGQKNEQLDNAVFLKNIGLAVILSQEYATSEHLLQEVDDIMANLASFSVKSEIDPSQHLHAAEDLIKLLVNTYEKKEEN